MLRCLRFQNSQRIKPHFLANPPFISLAFNSSIHSFKAKTQTETSRGKLTTFGTHHFFNVKERICHHHPRIYLQHINTEIENERHLWRGIILISISKKKQDSKHSSMEQSKSNSTATWDSELDQVYAIPPTHWCSNLSCNADKYPSFTRLRFQLNTTHEFVNQNKIILQSKAETYTDNNSSCGQVTNSNNSAILKRASSNNRVWNNFKLHL